MPKNVTNVFADQTDISSFATQYVSAMSNLSIVSGVGKNLFKPKDIVTREQIAKMLGVALSIEVIE